MRGKKRLQSVIDARKRETEILNLRYQGFTVAAIAEKYGISIQRVSVIYQRALRRVSEPVAGLERQRAIGVIDNVLQELWKILHNNRDDETKLRCCMTLLKWEEYRTRLLGLEIPVKLKAAIEDIRVTAGLSDETAMALRAAVFGGTVEQRQAFQFKFQPEPLPVEIPSMELIEDNAASALSGALDRRQIDHQDMRKVTPDRDHLD